MLATLLRACERRETVDFFSSVGGECAAASTSASTTTPTKRRSNRRQRQPKSRCNRHQADYRHGSYKPIRKLDWPGCKAVMQLYHMRVFVLGKMNLCADFSPPRANIVEKITRCVCTSRGNVELLSLPSRPTGSSEYPNRSAGSSWLPINHSVNCPRQNCARSITRPLKSESDNQTTRPKQ